MQASATTNAPRKDANPRLVETVDRLVALVRDFIRERKIRLDEFHQAIFFFLQCTEKKREIPLLLDLFFEMNVVEANQPNDGATSNCVLGPYYVEGAPELERPYEIPQRDSETGDPLIFNATVRDLAGEPLEGVVFDLWHSDEAGGYSQFDFPEPAWSLRGKMRSDAEGKLEFRTIMPAPYQIPHDGPVGSLLESLGRHSWRPAHLHFKITHPDCEPMVTQIYTSTSPWLDSDCVGAVKDSLIIACERHDDRKKIAGAGFKRPFYTATWDFVLRPAS